MESMLNIGNKDKHESAKNSAEAIVEIFRGARKHSMDQHIVERALEAFMRVAEIKQVTIANNVFTNNAVTKQEDPVADKLPQKSEEPAKVETTVGAEEDSDPDCDSLDWD